MIAEIALNAIGTIIAAAIMYVHSKGTLGHTVPKCLMKVVFIYDEKRKMTMFYKNKNNISATPSKVIVGKTIEHTAVSRKGIRTVHCNL
jgi:hypothetical protein